MKPDQAAISSLRMVLESAPGTVYLTTNEIEHRTGSLTSVHCPEIVIHCDKCDGDRTFRGESDQTRSGVSGNKFVTYRCSNCPDRGGCIVIFALIITKYMRPTENAGIDDEMFKVLKVGQKPAFGPPTPSRLTRLLEKAELENFRRGRRCESQGMGIGAFAYYRRTVENQKGRLFDSIVSALHKVAPNSALISELEAAKNEISFTKAMGKIRSALPESLLIEGQNPLTILHSSLSIGLHDRSDEECLHLARSIRILLVELMDRMDTISADHHEIREALATLMKHQNPQ